MIINKKKTKITILTGSGGKSDEMGHNETLISQASAKAVLSQLKKEGYVKVALLDFNEKTFIQDIKKANPDVVFNAMHGVFGEDGTVPLILDQLKIPYTHSGCIASRLGFDKKLNHQFLKGHDIPLVNNIVVTKHELVSGQYLERLKFLNGDKFILKPTCEGSSVSIHTFKKGEEKDWSRLADYKEFIIEEFIRGREFDVVIVNEEVLGIMEVVFSEEIFSYDCKYNDSSTQHIMPVDIAAHLQKQLQDIALKAHNLLGCKAVSRSEFKISPDDEIFMLEINTHPGFTQASIVPDVAAAIGLNFGALLEGLLLTAEFEKQSIALPKNAPLQAYSREAEKLAKEFMLENVSEEEQERMADFKFENRLKAATI